jgi:hypothetical protein
MYRDVREDDATTVFCPKGSLILTLESFTEDGEYYTVYLVDGKIALDLERLQLGAFAESMFEQIA